MIHSNIPKRPTVLAAVGLAVALVLSFALNPTPAFAKKTPPCKAEGTCGKGIGGVTEIALCMTLEVGGGMGITQLNEGDIFCDDAGLDAAIGDGTLGVGLRPPEARVELDFNVCVNTDPNCSNLDFGPIVIGGAKSDTTGLAGVGFNTGNAFPDDVDFANLARDMPTLTNLVVRFTFYSSIIDSPKHSNRTIHFGGPVPDESGDTCESDKVMVTRLEGTEADGDTTDDCWVVESLPDDEACLILDIKNGNNITTTLQGKYHMPFTMSLAKFADSFDSDGAPNDLVECPL